MKIDFVGYQVEISFSRRLHVFFRVASIYLLVFLFLLGPGMDLSTSVLPQVKKAQKKLSGYSAAISPSGEIYCSKSGGLIRTLFMIKIYGGTEAMER